jgi:hypothetical protein
LRPGQHLDTIKLSHSVPKGSFNVIAEIKYYSISTEDYISQSNYKIHMIVS